MRHEIDALVRQIHANLARSSDPKTQLEIELATLSLDGVSMARAARAALTRLSEQSKDDRLYATENLIALPRF